MTFIDLKPGKAPSKRGGVTIRLKHPSKGGGAHVEVSIFVEKPLAVALGWEPGGKAAVSLGQGDDTGKLRIRAEASGPFIFARTGGAASGGVMLSLGYSEAFGRAVGAYKVPHLAIRTDGGCMTLPLPEELKSKRHPGPPMPGQGEGRRAVSVPAAANGRPSPDPHPADGRITTLWQGNYSARSIAEAEGLPLLTVTERLRALGLVRAS